MRRESKIGTTSLSPGSATKSKSPSAKAKLSPIKIKDYFTNPNHKIKQAAFVEVGFTSSTLNTFVKSFTNRYNSHFISFKAIQQFIKSFTNNSPKLIKTYEDFFKKNFLINSDNNISLQSFVQFFTRQEQTRLSSFDDRLLGKLHNSLSELTKDRLTELSKHLEVSMSENQAKKIIKMLNYDAKQFSENCIGKQAFIKAMKKTML